MAYTTINKSTDYFNTKLYTGTGSSQAITGVGFQPDLLWLKPRSTTGYHRLFDAIRGAGYQLYSNTTSASGLDTNQMSAFNSDGFTLGNETGSNANGTTFVAWNWKAGTSISGSTVGLGTLKTYTGSVNTTAGFSVIKYTGNGTAGHQFPHGLGVAPKMVIVKRLNTSAQWNVYHASTGSTGATYLNDTGGFNTVQGFWNNAAPNSTSMPLGTDAAGNGNGDTYIAYCFRDVVGYSKFGSYTGNGSTDGTFVYTGFKPAWVLTKASSRTGRWRVWDNKRSTFNVADKRLDPSSSDAENTGSTEAIDMISNGFKIRTSEGQFNGSGETNIYMAFASAPLVGTNNVPCTAR